MLLFDSVSGKAILNTKQPNKNRKSKYSRHKKNSNEVC